MPIAPTTKKVTHPFGENRGVRRHNGIDYDVEKGTPVKASADGIVLRSTYHEPKAWEEIDKKGKKKGKMVKKIRRFLWKCDNFISRKRWKETKTYIYSIRSPRSQIGKCK